ncbi:MAG: hypothetical protein ACR652_20905 [Methylocystis sp.]|uniref:hypothetical protein n=1 Tax=Methylocystis sp. TaxID=1911079 RepID=UPI003DA2763A
MAEPVSKIPPARPLDASGPGRGAVRNLLKRRRRGRAVIADIGDVRKDRRPRRRRREKDGYCAEHGRLDTKTHLMSSLEMPAFVEAGFKAFRALWPSWEDRVETGADQEKITPAIDISAAFFSIWKRKSPVGPPGWIRASLG